MKKKEKREDYGLKLSEEYDNWAYLYEHGGSDPFWEDGVNLNLVRNHIYYYRGKIEETLSPENYPAAFFREIPPEVDNRYMARTDEIRAAARVSLERYKTDPDYRYILQHYNDFTPGTRKKLSIDGVIGYAAGLEKYIEEDNLVDMRRHELCERYLESFKNCARTMQQTPPEETQCSMFSLSYDLTGKADGDESNDGFDDGFEEEYDGRETETGDEIVTPEGDTPDHALNTNNEAETKSGDEIVTPSEEKDAHNNVFDNDNEPKTEPHSPTTEPLKANEPKFDITPDEVKTERRAADFKSSPYAHIPRELKNLDQWTVYRTYPDKENGKLKKIIVSPVNSSFAHSDKPETWVSYAQAKAYAERYRHYKGLAFALKEGVTFIDVDHAIENDVIVSPEAKRLLKLLPDAYTEKSASGTGIHILLKGALPNDAYRRNDGKGIEMYDKRRFVCMTGETLGGGREIKDYSDRIADIAYEFAGRRPPVREYAVLPATQTDRELIERISRSRSAVKFNALYKGDISAYSSHSHAESAMVFMLAWWTRNPAQIDGIIRSSGLIRPKWDERRGNGTYGGMLIDEALATVRQREQPQFGEKTQYYL
jgi:hypothetical protein